MPFAGNFAGSDEIRRIVDHVENCRGELVLIKNRMLPQKIESVMREQIDVNLRSNQFRPPRFDQRALGKSFNGGTLQPSKLVHALWGEIDLLGNIVLDAMRKVVSSAKVAPYSGITEDLLQIFESEVEPCMEDIRRIGGEKLAKISGPAGDGWFNRKADRARPAWKVDIKLMATEIGESEADAKMETIESMPSRDEAFVCYSRANKKWLERVRVHLRPLERRGLLKLFDDTKIKPGTRWREEIKAALNRARVAILLVSADFLASEFIAENELPPLLEKAESGGATILAVIVSPCGFRREKKLADYQAVNDPSKPLDSLTESESEQVLTELADAVEAALSAVSGVNPTTGASQERAAETEEKKLPTSEGARQPLQLIQAGSREPQPVIVAIDELKSLLEEGETLVGRFQEDPTKPTLDEVVDWRKRTCDCAHQNTLSSIVTAADLLLFDKAWDEGKVRKAAETFVAYRCVEHNSADCAVFRYLWGNVERLKQLIAKIEGGPPATQLSAAPPSQGEAWGISYEQESEMLDILKDSPKAAVMVMSINGDGVGIRYSRRLHQVLRATGMESGVCVFGEPWRLPTGINLWASDSANSRQISKLKDAIRATNIECGDARRKPPDVSGSIQYGIALMIKSLQA